MAEAYLSSLLSSAETAVQARATAAVAISQCRVTSLVLQGRVELSETANDLGSLIAGLRESVPEDDFQQRLLERTLKEKDALQAKLEALNSTLEVLRPKEVYTPQPPRKLSEVRRDTSAEAVRKKNATRAFVHSIQRRKRTEFEAAYSQIQRELQARISKAEKAEQQQLAEEQRRLQQFHDAQRAKFREKVEKHKSVSPVPCSKPVKVVCTAMRASSPQPQPKEKVSAEELAIHELRYLEWRKERDIRRNRLRKEQLAVQNEAEVTPPATPENERHIAQVKSLLARRNRYALLVREVFKPEVDERMKELREGAVAEMLRPKARTAQPGFQPRKSAHIRVLHHSQESPLPLREKQRKSLSPEVQKPKVDYLLEMKKQSEHSVASDLQALLRLSPTLSEHQSLEAAERLATQVARHEATLKRVPLTHPLAIDAQQNATAAMVTAVKAKLALFASAVAQG